MESFTPELKRLLLAAGCLFVRNGKGQVTLKLKTSWKNGAIHIVLEPLEFMQRLAALMPRPRLHLTRFHGVLAPNAKLRSKVLPKGAQTTVHTREHAAHSAPVLMSWARLLKRVFEIDMEHCACVGQIKFIAVIEQPEVIEKILTHLGLSPQPPPIVPVLRERLFDVDEAARDATQTLLKSNIGQHPPWPTRALGLFKGEGKNAR